MTRKRGSAATRKRDSNIGGVLLFRVSPFPRFPVSVCY